MVKAIDSQSFPRLKAAVTVIERYPEVFWAFEEVKATDNRIAVIQQG